MGKSAFPIPTFRDGGSMPPVIVGPLKPNSGSLMSKGCMTTSELGLLVSPATSGIPNSTEGKDESSECIAVTGDGVLISLDNAGRDVSTDGPERSADGPLTS